MGNCVRSLIKIVVFTHHRLSDIIPTENSNGKKDKHYGI